MTTLLRKTTSRPIFTDRLLDSFAHSKLSRQTGNPLKTHIRQFSALTSAELADFCSAWLRLFGWRLRMILGRLPEPASESASDLSAASLGVAERHQVDRLVLAVNRAARYHFVRCNCLLRSLALHSMLRHAGIATKLEIGVNKSADGVLAAHAWLIAGDELLNDRLSNVGSYQVMQRRR